MNTIHTYQVVWPGHTETHGDRTGAMSAAAILSRDVPLVQVWYRGREVATFRAETVAVAA